MASIEVDGDELERLVEIAHTNNPGGFWEENRCACGWNWDTPHADHVSYMIRQAQRGSLMP